MNQMINKLTINNSMMDKMPKILIIIAIKVYLNMMMLLQNNLAGSNLN
jgi:hypothetical protein